MSTLMVSNNYNNDRNRDWRRETCRYSPPEEDKRDRRHFKRHSRSPSRGRTNTRKEELVHKGVRLVASIGLGAMEALQREFFNDKLVLCFEGVVNKQQVDVWLNKYNSQHSHQLEVVEQLVNALYVVKVEAKDIDKSVGSLLCSRPLYLVEQDKPRANLANLAGKMVALEDRLVLVNSYH